MNKISIIIPCYGSEHTIRAVVNEIIEVLNKRRGYDYEVILINDSSPDRVMEVIGKMCASNKRIKAASLSRNFGQQSALLAGQSLATGNILVCMDDDGQSPSENIYAMVDMLGPDCDVVFAKYGIKKQSLIKNLGSWMNSLMLSAFLNKPRQIEFSSFFVMKRFVSDEMIKYKNPYPYNMGLILSITRRIENFACEDRKRLAGRTGYTFGKLINLWVNGLTNFSVAPLRFATYAGMTGGMLGFAFGIYTVVNKIINPDVPVGYSAIISMISFVGGVILIVLGIIGEYLGRLYMSINRIPQYILRDRINLKP
ncbi:MAG: glycosyltransferase family 2 protein [Spirochaetia bacterium]|nr:glycosyltransferase family 2 protein [Spirochaetia bacterium]